MEFNYGPYDVNKANVIETPDKSSVFAYPANMNPHKTINMACYRNDSNQIVVSLMDGNSQLYSASEWDVLSKTPPLRKNHEEQMLNVIASAQDAIQHFIENE